MADKPPRRTGPPPPIKGTSGASRRLLKGTPGFQCKWDKIEEDRTTKNRATLLKALQANLGNITAATAKVGVSRETHYYYLEHDKEYAKEWEAIRESGIDFAETCLFQQMKDGNSNATIFFLKTRGKHRGYTFAPFQIENPLQQEILAGALGIEDLEAEISEDALDSIFSTVADGLKKQKKFEVAQKEKEEKVEPPPSVPRILRVVKKVKAEA